MTNTRGSGIVIVVHDGASVGDSRTRVLAVIVLLRPFVESDRLASGAPWWIVVDVVNVTTFLEVVVFGPYPVGETLVAPERVRCLRGRCHRLWRQRWRQRSKRTGA